MADSGYTSSEAFMTVATAWNALLLHRSVEEVQWIRARATSILDVNQVRVDGNILTIDGDTNGWVWTTAAIEAFNRTKMDPRSIRPPVAPQSFGTTPESPAAVT